jgi:pyroglutamyl-peptidase
MPIADRPLLLLALAAAVLAGAALLALAAGRARDASERTLLLTGFGPFRDVGRNPSWEVARRLDGEVVAGWRIRARRLDVAYARAGDQLAEALAAVPADGVLCLGVAPGEALRLEALARNLDDCPDADVEGAVRDGRAIREGAPGMLPSRLPLLRLHERLTAGGFAVDVSDDAGGYLCNHVFFRLLDDGPQVGPAGFVHVPVLGGRWDLDRLEAAIRTIVGAL